MKVGSNSVWLAFYQKGNLHLGTQREAIDGDGGRCWGKEAKQMLVAKKPGSAKSDAGGIFTHNA